MWIDLQRSRISSDRGKAAPGLSSKLLSLTSGHCGLKDCSSPAYEIVYPEKSSISWGDLLDSAQQSSEAPKKEEEEPARLEAAILEDPSSRLRKIASMVR